MNNKLKRVLSIIALASMGVFVVLLPFLFFNTKFMGENTVLIVLCFLVVSVLIFLTIYMFRAFPSQQVKDAERRRQEAENYAAMQKQSGENQQKDNQSAENQSQTASDNQPEDNTLDLSKDNKPKENQSVQPKDNKADLSKQKQSSKNQPVL